jgi:hypothetical protein
MPTADFSVTSLPSAERDRITAISDLGARARHLCLSKDFNPHEAEWRALADGVASAGLWGRNVSARCAELLALGEKEMARLMRKRTNAPTHDMNLFESFGEDAVASANSGTTVVAAAAASDPVGTDASVPVLVPAVSTKPMMVLPVAGVDADCAVIGDVPVGTTVEG